MHVTSVDFGTWPRLAKMARKLIAEHSLEVRKVPNERQYIKLAVEAAPSLRKYTVRKGREIWGPHTGYEIDEFLKDHKKQLEADYPLMRSYWPHAMRDAWLWQKMPADIKPSMALAWHRTLLGEPYSDFPEELDWRVMLYQHWLDQFRIWRFEFEAEFTKEFPEADQVDLFHYTNGNIWNDWRIWVYSIGFARTKARWRRDALTELEPRRELIGVLY